MTLQARTPTEAFFVCKNSFSSFRLGFATECFFSIFEEWKTPNAPSTGRTIFRMPSAYMHGAVVPKKTNSQKPRGTETTPIYIDWQWYIDDGSPWYDPYEETAWISGDHEDLAEAVNFELLSYLLNADEYRDAGVAS